MRESLDEKLRQLLARRGDEFRPGAEYMRQWGYPMGDDGAVPYGV